MVSYVLICVILIPIKQTCARAVMLPRQNALCPFLSGLTTLHQALADYQLKRGLSKQMPFFLQKLKKPSIYILIDFCKRQVKTLNLNISWQFPNGHLARKPFARPLLSRNFFDIPSIKFGVNKKVFNSF